MAYGTPNQTTLRAQFMYFCAAFMLCLLTFSSLSFAEEDRTIPTFAIYRLHPFYYVDSEGSPSGLNYEIVKKVFNGAGVPHKVAILPIGRVFHAMEQGQHDFTMSYKVPDVFPGLKFFGSVGCQQIVLAPMRGSGIKSLPDAKGKRISFIQGGRFDKIFSKTKAFTRLPAINTLTMFKLAAYGRADAIVGNRMLLASYKNDPSVVHILSPDFWEEFDAAIPITPIEIAFSISEKSKFQHYVPILEAYTRTEEVQNFIHEIYSRYGETTGGRCNMMTKNKFTFSEATEGINSDRIAEHQK